MGPSFSIQEILLIGIIALIVVGPKDLPLMLRKLGKFVGQAKKLAREFQSSFDELGRQAELEELKKEVESLKREATGDIDKEFTKTQREISEAMRESAEPRIAPPAGGDKGSETSEAAPPPPPPPSGPRIEPAGEARPRPRPAAAETADPAAARATSDQA